MGVQSWMMVPKQELRDIAGIFNFEIIKCRYLNINLLLYSIARTT